MDTLRIQDCGNFSNKIERVPCYDFGSKRVYQICNQMKGAQWDNRITPSTALS